MTRLEIHINNFDETTMEALYGCRHAVAEHLYQGKQHLRYKLKKNSYAMKNEWFIHACMFESKKEMAETIREALTLNQDVIQNYLDSSRTNDLEIEVHFDHAIAKGIGTQTDPNQFLPASSLKVVLNKDHYTSFRIITAYAFPGFRDMDIWYDAIDEFEAKR